VDALRFLDLTMAARRKRSNLERRLKEIEREKAELRARLDEVRRGADAAPAEYAPRSEPRLRAAAVPESQLREVSARALLEVEEREASELPADETSLDFAPGPDGLDVKRVVMPRLQRTDLLRPAIGGAASATRLVEPEHDRFRNYFGSAGLKRVREARREQGSQRVRAISCC
jgi:hypothetical protein